MQSLQLTLVMDLCVPVRLLVRVTSRIWDWKDSVLPQSIAKHLLSWRLLLFLWGLGLLLALVLALILPLRAVLILVGVLLWSLVSSLVWSSLPLIALGFLDFLGVWHKFKCFLWPLLLLICVVQLSDINL